MATKKPTRTERALEEFIGLYQQLAELEFLLNVPLKMHTDFTFAETDPSIWKELFTASAPTPKQAVAEAKKALPSFGSLNGRAISLATDLYAAFLDHPGWRTPGKRQPNCAQIMDDVFESLMCNGERFWIFRELESSKSPEEQYRLDCDIFEENEESIKAVESVSRVVKERCSRVVNRLSDLERQEAIDRLIQADSLKKRINPAMPTYVKEMWRWELEPKESQSKEGDEIQENSKT